jgi:hypothetical protein
MMSRSRRRRARSRRLFVGRAFSGERRPGGQLVGVGEAGQPGVAAAEDTDPAMIDQQAASVECKRTQVGPDGHLDPVQLASCLFGFDGQDLDRDAAGPKVTFQFRPGRLADVGQLTQGPWQRELRSIDLAPDSQIEGDELLPGMVGLLEHPMQAGAGGRQVLFEFGYTFPCPAGSRRRPDGAER